MSKANNVRGKSPNSATLHAHMSSTSDSKTAAFVVAVADHIHDNLHLRVLLDGLQRNPHVQTVLNRTKDGLDIHDVYKGAKAAVRAAPYVGNMNALIKDSGASGGASVLGVFVDRFGAMAKQQGIELNECALNVAKLSTDIGGVGVGTVGSVTGPADWLFLGISIVSTFQDSKSMAQACLPEIMK